VILDVSHRTRFVYSDWVPLSQHLLHLAPRATATQQVLGADLKVDPPPTRSHRSRDYFGNRTHYLTVQRPHRELTIEALSAVEVTAPPKTDPATSRPWEDVARMLARIAVPDVLEAAQYAFNSPHAAITEDIRGFARRSASRGRTVLAIANDLTQRIHAEFRYTGGVTDISTPAHEVLARRRGVCQDFAHLQIAALRSLGLAARYVSGYLLTRPPEGREKLVGADASHAWVSVWCPEHGWVDFDPTNGLVPSDEHVTLAWGRDYADVSPVNGFIVGGGQHQVLVSVTVAPRARRPSQPPAETAEAAGKGARGPEQTG
jgi:transglutaminase-like putative cysteine protease